MSTAPRDLPEVFVDYDKVSGGVVWYKENENGGIRIRIPMESFITLRAPRRLSIQIGAVEEEDAQ
jgi:hypothetical protein